MADRICCRPSTFARPAQVSEIEFHPSDWTSFDLLSDPTTLQRSEVRCLAPDLLDAPHNADAAVVVQESPC